MERFDFVQPLNRTCEDTVSQILEDRMEALEFFERLGFRGDCVRPFRFIEESIEGGE